MTHGTQFVPYYRYLVTFRLPDGRRRRWVRHAPAYPYMREAFVRELCARGIEPEALAPGSVAIREDW